MRNSNIWKIIVEFKNVIQTTKWNYDMKIVKELAMREMAVYLLPG